MHPCLSVLSCFSHVWLFVTPCIVEPTKLLCPLYSPGKNTGVVCRALMQGLFLTQGWKLHFLQVLHWQVGSLPQTLCGKPTHTCSQIWIKIQNSSTPKKVPFGPFQLSPNSQRECHFWSLSPRIGYYVLVLYVFCICFHSTHAWYPFMLHKLVVYYFY